jgi:Trypsin/PEP-CTERM motif
MLRGLLQIGRKWANSPRPGVGRSLLLAGLLLVSLFASAHGGTIRHDRDDSLYLSLAADPAFDPVGKFTWNEPGYSYLASGTLIRNDWVLTAGHVVGGTDGLGAGVSNLKFKVGGTTYTADQWIPQPQWATSNESLTAGWDIGLVHLATDVSGIVPAELFLPEYGSELGLVGTEVGFGDTGTGLTGYDNTTAGTKRAGQNILDVVGTAETSGTPNHVFNNNRLMAVDFDNPGGGGYLTNPYGSGTPLNLEYLVAPGDSGGGLFLDVEGEMKLAGVTSYISSVDFNTNCDYGDLAGFIRVSQFVDWINDTIGPEELVVLYGDYNSDGVIDAADYAVWRDALESGGALPNDPTPELVDDSDFYYWRDHFGETLGGGAGLGSGALAVPEPTSLDLLLCGGLVAAAARRR